MELQLMIQEGTLYLLEEGKQVVPAELVTVQGASGYVLLFVGGGYVPARLVEGRFLADACFVVESNPVVWCARLGWVTVEDEAYGQFEDIGCYADLQSGDSSWRVMAPSSLGSAYETLRIVGALPKGTEVRA